MKDKQNKHIVDIMFVIALFSIFVLSAIFLISIGAGIYSKTMSTMTSNFNSRTAVAYIMEKARQSDVHDSVSVGDFDGNEALVITSTVHDKDYITYIYEYEGVIKELMVRTDITLSPSAGQDIIAVDSFHITPVNDSLVRCSVVMEEKESYEFYIDIRSGQFEGGAEDE